MRSRNLQLTLASLALLLSFQEQCRIQAQEVEASSSKLSSLAQRDGSAYPASSRLGRQHAAEQEAIQKRSSAALRRASKASALRRRQELLDDDSAPAVVVRPVRQSSTSSSSSTSSEDDEDADLSRAVRAAAATAALTRSIEVSNGARPGAPTSTSVSIPVSETDVTSPSSSSSTRSSSFSRSASSSSTDSSSPSTEETSSSVPTSTSSPSSSSTSSRRTLEAPSTVIETTTMSSSETSSAAEPTDTAEPISNVWQAYNKSSKYFPVAIVVTVVIGIAILVALVAILQCIARHPRFRKDKDRPLLIPRDSTWSDSNASGISSNTSAFGNEDNANRRDSISSQAAAAKRISWETFNGAAVGGASPSRVSSNASTTYKQGQRGVERDITANSSATWAKEDFLPHSGEMENANNGSNTPGAFSVVDIYPALPKFRGPMTAPTSASTASNLGSPYPPFPVTSAAAGGRHQLQSTLPVIKRVDPAIHAAHPYQQQQQPMMERLGRAPSILFKPRPGPEEQQSGHRLSMSGRSGLPSHVVLPPGVSERRRWERCST